MEGGNRDLVKLLLDDGMSCHSKPKSMQAKERAFTPLHLAARLGFAELVPLLLDDGYTVDTVDQEGRTPLHCASLGMNLGWYETRQATLGDSRPLRASPEQSNLAKELLVHGADPKLVDPSLYSTLHYTSGELPAASVASSRQQEVDCHSLSRPMLIASKRQLTTHFFPL